MHAPRFVTSDATWTGAVLTVEEHQYVAIDHGPANGTALDVASGMVYFLMIGFTPHVTRKYKATEPSMIATASLGPPGAIAGDDAIMTLAPLRNGKLLVKIDKGAISLNSI
jgi:hypothetical protein